MTDLKLNRAVSRILPNGLKFIIHNDPSEPVVCIQAVVRSGSANETAPNAGFSHFIEHLAFKSSKRFGFNQISSTVSNLGGSLNAYTDFDSTCYYLLLPSEHLEAGLEIITELLVNARFTAADVETEKDIILDEIDQYQDDPETDFLEYIQAQYFKRCPLRKPIVGTPISVKAATHAKLKAFYKRRYHPANCFVVISGDADPQRVEDSLAGYIGSWKSSAEGKNSKPSWLEPETGRPGLRWQKANQNLFALVLPELSEIHPMADALLIAIRYLAIGRASRLHKILVEDKKLCSAVRVSSLCGVMSGASVIMFVPSRKTAIPAIAAVVREELNALWSQGIPLREFELVCQDVLHGWLFGFEARENIANLLVAEELLGDYNTLYDYGDRIRNLTPADVEKAVKHYWQPAMMTLFHRGPALVELPHELIPGYASYRFKTQISSKETLPAAQISFPCPPAVEPTGGVGLVQVDERHWEGLLTNGIRFAFKRLAPNPISGFALSSPVSQLWEGPSQRGYNYFLSTSLLYQSQRYSHQAIMDHSRRLGMNIRVSHNIDTTTYKGKCFQQDMPQALGLLTELLGGIKLDRAYLHTLKSAAADSLRRERDNPPGYGYLLWLRAAFGKRNPLERATGDLTDIAAIKISDLQDWYEKHYHPANYHLAVCASSEAEEVFEIVDRCLGSITPASSTAVPHPHPVRFLKPGQKVSNGANGQSVIHFGAPATSSEDRVSTTACHLLAQIVGGDTNSRFFDIIREKNGLAYQTGMDMVTLDQLGYWTAYAFCGREDQKTCLELMREIIQDIAERGVTEQELISAKNYMNGMHLFDCESVSYQASALANLFALGYPITHHLERSKRIASIDMDVINSVAAKYLGDPHKWVHILQ